jgi:hypothetical protein
VVSEKKDDVFNFNYTTDKEDTKQLHSIPKVKPSTTLDKVLKVINKTLDLIKKPETQLYKLTFDDEN